MSTSRFLTGALVGLVTGLLLAPEKGEDLRSDIADQAKDLKKKLYKMAGKANAELNDLKGLLANEVEGLSDDVRERILAMIEDGEDTAKNIKKKVVSTLG